MTKKTMIISNLQDTGTHQSIINYKIRIINLKQSKMEKKINIRKSFPLSFRL